MYQGLTLTGIIAAALAFAGCTAYRPEPLKPQVELRALQQRTVATSVGTEVKRSTGVVGDYHPEDGLDEAELVMVALSFNPALREKRQEISQVGAFDLLGAIRFKPEMRVDVDRTTIGLATDTDMLYTLLVPSLRQAWRDDDTARRETSRAEMLAAEAQVVVDVRRAHVFVLVDEERVSLAQRRVQHRRMMLDHLEQDPRATPLDRALAAVAWERALSDARHDAGDLADARRELNRVLGFDPSIELHLTSVGRPLIGQVSVALANDDLDQKLLTGRWELRALEAAYKRAEYTYSQAVMGQYPRLKLAPAITYDREEGTSLKFGASLRLPWPEDAREKMANEAVNRDRARALYLEKLHALRAEAHGANARLTRALEEMSALERSRKVTAEALAEGTSRQAAGDLSFSLYLSLVERCEDLGRAWLDTAERYHLARIDLDHAIGRLNHSRDDAPAP
jgi:outer membrane protein, heavy metal efflux system